MHDDRLVADSSGLCNIVLFSPCVVTLSVTRQVDEPADAAVPTPAAPSKPAAPRDAAMEDIDDDLQKALALSMQVGHVRCALCQFDGAFMPWASL